MSINGLNDFNDWEEDWENIEIPDLSVNVEELKKNKERELKLLEDRKRMEEADLALTKDLFDNINEKHLLDKIEIVKLTKEKTKELIMLQLKKKQDLYEKQKMYSLRLKEKKQQQQKHKELYGEAEVDKYSEMYGDIEDKY